MSSEAPRRNRVLPYVLILAGALLLLANVTDLGWAFWSGLLELWPLLLVALGADVLTRGRYRLWVVAGTVLVGAALWAVTPLGLGATPAETHSVQYQLGEAETAAVTLAPAVARMRLGALPQESDDLLAGEVATGRNESLERTFQPGPGASLRLASQRAGGTFWFGGGGGSRSWDLALTSRVPVDLTLDTGVGETVADLRGVTLTALDLDAGVGSVRLTLPEAGGFDATVDAGVGEVMVRVPEDLTVRVGVDAGIGSAQVLGDFERDGEEWVTPGFAASDEAVDLRVNGGVGEVTVERTP